MYLSAWRRLSEINTAQAGTINIYPCTISKEGIETVGWRDKKHIFFFFHITALLTKGWLK